MRARILKLTLALTGIAGAVYAADLATAPYSADQMLGLAQSYDKDMQTTIEHAQDVRIVAYRSRDIIRMTCVDDKLTQIKMVMEIAQPRYLTMRTFRTAELVMREQFSI